MSLLKIATISVGATMVTWIPLVAFNGEQTLDRLAILLVGYLFLVWGLF
jgi:hypothetical protein